MTKTFYDATEFYSRKDLEKVQFFYDFTNGSYPKAEKFNLHSLLVNKGILVFINTFFSKKKKKESRTCYFFLSRIVIEFSVKIRPPCTNPLDDK